MRHHTVSRRLGVKTGHRNAMLRNLSMALVEHGRITTTTARAKVLRSFLEKQVTRLKEPSVANIRTACRDLANKKVVMKIANDISPKFQDRPGGYLRILKLAQPRVGDCADMSMIEWVEPSLVNYYASQDEKGSTAKKAAPKKKAKAETAKSKAKKKTTKSAKS